MAFDLQGLLTNPMLSIGLSLLNRNQTNSEALQGALGAGLSSIQAQNQLSSQKELRDFRKKKGQLYDTQLEEENQKKLLLKKLFGDTKLSPEQLSQQLTQTGDPKLIDLALKIKPKPEVQPRLQTFPIGTERVTGYFDEGQPLSQESFNPLFRAPRSVSSSGGGGRVPRLTRDEKLAQELQGVDLTSMSKEELDKKLFEVGQKTGRLDLLAKGKQKKVSEGTKVDTLSKDLILYNKMYSSSGAGTSTNIITGQPGISKKEFISRADVLRFLQKENPDRKLSDAELLDYFSGSADDFGKVIESFRTGDTKADIKPQKVYEKSQKRLSVDKMGKLSPEQQQKLDTVLANRNMSDKEKEKIIKAIQQKLGE